MHDTEWKRCMEEEEILHLPYLRRVRNKLLECLILLLQKLFSILLFLSSSDLPGRDASLGNG
jgi:hypothetical protein